MSGYGRVRLFSSLGGARFLGWTINFRGWTDLGVGEEELATLGEAKEDVSGLDGRHRHGVLQAEGQPHRESRELWGQDS